MKKLIALLLVVAFVAGSVGCSSSTTGTKTSGTTTGTGATTKP